MKPDFLPGLDRNNMENRPRFCESCGTPLTTSDRFCGACGKAVSFTTALFQENVSNAPDGISPANPVEEKESALPELTWDFDMPLVTNRFMLYDMVKVLGWSYLIMTVLMSAIFLIQGETDALLPIYKMFGYVILFIAFLFLFVMAVIFGYRFPYRFVVGREGLLMESLSRRGRFLNRAAVVAGLLSGKMQPTGAGLLAMSQETVGIQWEDIHKIKEYPNLCIISLMNSWRVVARLYCTQANYDRVIQIVREGVAEGEKTRNQNDLPAEPSIVPSLLKWSGGVLLALCLITAIPYPFDIQGVALWVTIIALLLAIWLPFLTRFAGGVAALAVAYQILVICWRGFEVRQLIPDSVLKGTPVPNWAKYQLWSVLNTAGWVRLGLTAAGFAILIFIAVRALSNSLRPRNSDNNASLSI
jgi:hypothetical protein